MPDQARREPVDGSGILFVFGGEHDGECDAGVSGGRLALSRDRRDGICQKGIIGPVRKIASVNR
jgi:hypothetical protein